MIGLLVSMTDMNIQKDNDMMEVVLPLLGREEEANKTKEKQRGR